jgi:hypothetical protein
MFYVGLTLALFALVLQHPSAIEVNGYSVKNWVVVAALGFGLAACGIVLVGKARKLG